MPTTRKQKKARKSRGLEMLSDNENLDVMLGGNFSDVEREESLNSNLAEGLKVLSAKLLKMMIGKCVALRRQSGKNGDCNKSVVVLCGFLNCIITHAFQELTKVE